MKTNKNKDIIPLDTPEGPEYDTERALKHEYDNLEFSSLSSSCLTRGSRNTEVDMNANACSGHLTGFRIKSGMTGMESGRSMVEMLGTLAIIGVLSIGGIIGYSYGMDKYCATETINDVNLRAMDVIAQLSQGNTPTLESWEETGTAGYPISLNSNEAPANYYIKVEKVPFEVCDIISETMPEAVRILVDNETEQCAEGLNTLEFEYEDFDEAQGYGDCPSGTLVEGLGGYSGISNADGNRCYCANADTKWDSASSSCVVQDGTCSSYADCDKGEFCQFSPSACTDATYVESPTKGVCKSLSICGEKGENDRYWMSDYNCKVDWWTAQDICASKNMTMVSLKDVGCENAKNSTCTSDTLSSIRNTGMVRGFWTTDPYYEGSASNFCSAWVFSASNQVYGGRRHNYSGIAALCLK